METESRHHDHLDPRGELDELKRLQDAVAVEAWMPATPLWHAPLLGLGLAGFMYAVEGLGIGRLFGLMVAVGLSLFGVWDTMRRRTAKPKRLGKPLRIFAFYFVVIVVTWLILSGFTAAMEAVKDQWPDQVGPLVAATAAGFLVSSILFAIGIEVTNRWRNRWVGSNR